MLRNWQFTAYMQCYIKYVVCCGHWFTDVSGHLIGHCHMTQSVHTECSNLSKWHWDKQNVHLNIKQIRRLYLNLTTLQNLLNEGIYTKTTKRPEQTLLQSCITKSVQYNLLTLGLLSNAGLQPSSKLVCFKSQLCFKGARSQEEIRFIIGFPDI